MTDSEERASFEIERIGVHGDGVATGMSGPVYFPFTLPGESVSAIVDGERASDVRITNSSPLRVKPLCRHFGRCGGCALQHLGPNAVLQWKREQVLAALTARGIETEVGETIAVAPGTRRRAVFSARRTKTGSQIGYHEARSHDIAAVTQCPVLLPQIVAALPLLPPLVMALASRKGELRLTVTACDNGLDVMVQGARSPLDDRARQAAIAASSAVPLLRLTVDGEPVYQAEEPRLSIGQAIVVPTPGAFLQAAEMSQRNLTGLVLEGIAGAGRVADLFCGLGTFSIPIAAVAEVLAVESDAGMLGALSAAVARTAGLKPVQVLRRDLFQDPLAVRELARFDAVVFDPPRAGARAQAEMLAASQVPRIVAVSCNPATLARDLRILVDGGYIIEAVRPVDQFLFSPHVEVVATLRRG